MAIVPIVNPENANTPEYNSGGVAPMRNYAPQQIQQLGQETESAGLRQMSVGAHVALKIQEQMDDANVKAAEGKFIQSATDILHGDKGYIHTQGADAINAFDGAQQAIVKAKKDAETGLQNDIQRRMFQQVSQNHLINFGAAMSEHRAVQRKEYTAGESFARVDSMRSAAQSVAPDSSEQNTLIETAVKAGLEGLETKGIPKDSEEAKKYERTIRSTFLQDNVSRLMEEGKFKEADALLSAQMKAGNVEGDTGDRLRRAIRGNLLVTQTVEKSDAIFAPYQGKELKGADLEAMLSDAAKVENPEQRQHVENAVRAKFNEVHTMQALEYRDNLNDVVNILASNGGNVRKVDPVKWGKLDAKDQADLMPKPHAAETDINVWYRFVTQPDSVTLQNVNDAYARGSLSRGDFKNFTEMAMRQQNQKQYVQEASGVNDRINYFANQSGLNVYDAKTPEDKIQHGQLTYAVQNEIDRVKAQNKGKITSQQVDEIIKKELTQRTLNIPRASLSPMRLLGNKTYQEQRRTFQIPEGSVGIGVGDDGKKHYVDAKGNDLGAAE